MKVLGVSSHYHDASAALVIDGQIVAAAAEERFTREKHDPSFPHNAIHFCLEQAGLSSTDLDCVVYHEDPMTKLTRNLSASMDNFPYSLPNFIGSMRDAISSGFWIRHELSKKLEIDYRKILFVPHHLSHAAHSFLTSPFEEAAIVTLDAVGEWNSNLICRGYRDSSGFLQIEPLAVTPFPHSLGLVYSAFTTFLGFRANDGECSTMALAAFGQPTYAEQIRNILQVKADGTYSIDLRYFDFSAINRIPVTPLFLSTFGEPRDIKDSLPFDCLSDEPAPILDANHRRYVDVAASLQLVLEETVLQIAKQAQVLTSSKNLCLGGGVALNCVANSKLEQSSIFERVYCPPDPGDGGAALGAALYASLLRKDVVSQQRNFSPYFGQAADSSEILELLQELDPKNWRKYSRLPLPSVLKDGIRITKTKNGDELTDLVSTSLKNRKIVGWVQGRFENGPRALGNRSILALPGDLELAKKISRTVKSRASFRPYACSVLQEQASFLFESSNPADSMLSKWMLSSVKVRADKAVGLRAAMHVDGTTRAQIVSHAENPKFHTLLKAMEQKTGLGALLNTSFNESRYPIVSTAMDALISFARTGLDILVIEDVVIEKN